MPRKEDILVARVREQHLFLTGGRLPQCFVGLHDLPGGSTLFQATRTHPSDPIDSAFAIASYVVCGDCGGIDPCNVTITGHRRVTIARDPNSHHRH